jgi:hypothetical protein
MKLRVVAVVAQLAMLDQTVLTRQAVLELHYWDLLWAVAVAVAPNTDQVAVCQDQVAEVDMLMCPHPLATVAVATVAE